MDTSTTAQYTTRFTWTSKNPVLLSALRALNTSQLEPGRGPSELSPGGLLPPRCPTLPEALRRRRWAHRGRGSPWQKRRRGWNGWKVCGSPSPTELGRPGEHLTKKKTQVENDGTWYIIDVAGKLMESAWYRSPQKAPNCSMRFLVIPADWRRILFFPMRGFA